MQREYFLETIKKVMFLVLIWSSSAAQDVRLNIIAKTEKQQIILRWMPMDYQAFKTGLDQGYVLSRKTIRRNGLVVTEAPIVLTPKPLKALKESFWEKEGKENRFAYVAWQLIKSEDPGDQEGRDLNLALTMLMSNTSATISNALGMLYFDKTIKEGEEYEYTVNTGEGLTSSVHAKAGEITRLIPPDSLYGDFADSTLFLRWRVADTLLHSAFLIERSDDGGVKFNPVNTEPVLISTDPDSSGNTFASYSVKLEKFHYKYVFRVRAFTPFGQLSDPSAHVEVTGYRDKIPMPRVKHSLIPHKGVRLEWSYPDSLHNDIRGFEILVSDTPDGKYEYLLKNTLPRNDRRYDDTLIRADAYYKVAAVTLAGKFAPSIAEFVQVDDTIPPVKPRWVLHRVSKEGVVRLKWYKNKERDFYGYSVFRADNPKAEFSVITPEMIRDSVFHDTLALNVLNRKVYYTIVAYDHHLNASIHADTLVVMRPDTLPPVPPVFGEYLLTDTHIQFQWHASSSADLGHTVLMRYSALDTLTLGSWKATASPGWMTYTDSTIAERTDYTYVLIAVDETGLSTNSKPVKLQKMYTGVRAGIEPLTFSYEESSIRLSWPIPSRKVKKYLLYRQGPSDSYLGLYKVFEGMHGTFTDASIIKNRRYLYALQAVYEDDSRSALGTGHTAILSEK